jgi:hypothetical protein
MLSPILAAAGVTYKNQFWRVSLRPLAGRADEDWFESPKVNAKYQLGVAAEAEGMV